MERTELLVVGAGPYAFSAAALAREQGIDTRMVGRPMSFWRDRMPAGMRLRSSAGWHLDAAGEATLTAYLEDQDLRAEELDPLPVSVFLDYAAWFAERKGLEADPRLLSRLAVTTDGFVAWLEDGSLVGADRVLAAPGIGSFAHLPGWYVALPQAVRAHTSDLVRFDHLAGKRVAVIGGGQSAYEWAALLAEHDAASVDVIHRHPTPAFATSSWDFVEEHVANTLADPGWWRRLPTERQQEIIAAYREVDRRTLEPWLPARLPRDVVTSHPDCEVTTVTTDADGVRLGLSAGGVLGVDQVVFATGYQVDLAQVPYLAPVLDRVAVTHGFPELSEGLETSLPGLFLTGCAATRDFGPVFGFTRGCTPAARILVEGLLRPGAEAARGAAMPEPRQATSRPTAAPASRQS